MDDSFSVRPWMSMVKNTSCFFKKEGVFERVGFVGREIKRDGDQTTGGNSIESH